MVIANQQHYRYLMDVHIPAAIEAYNEPPDETDYGQAWARKKMTANRKFDV